MSRIWIWNEKYEFSVVLRFDQNSGFDWYLKWKLRNLSRFYEVNFALMKNWTKISVWNEYENRLEFLIGCNFFSFYLTS